MLVVIMGQVKTNEGDILKKCIILNGVHAFQTFKERSSCSVTSGTTALRCKAKHYSCTALNIVADREEQTQN